MATAVSNNRAIRGPVTAVPVVAGDGIRLVKDTDNNRFVVELDETELWSGSQSGTGSITLSESATNFKRLRFTLSEGSSSINNFESIVCTEGATDSTKYIYPYYSRTNSSGDMIFAMWSMTISGTSIDIIRTVLRTNGTTSGTNNYSVVKIEGIDRISGGN